VASNLLVEAGLIVEWNANGSRVNVMIPKTIKTPALAALNAETIATLSKKVPPGQLSCPSVQAGVAVSLAPAISFFMTGQTFAVDFRSRGSLIPACRHTRIG
jgi:NAD(P)-dependent dehydrogenase (short-subunit alcohol dehydrogenase family)